MYSFLSVRLSRWLNFALLALSIKQLLSWLLLLFIKISIYFLYHLLVDGSCEVDISPVGCYKEDSAIPAMGEIFHNEAAPDKPNFVGNMIQSVDNYEAYFPDFLCKCARKARENGWEYFGVRELGREIGKISDGFLVGELTISWLVNAGATCLWGTPAWNSQRGIGNDKPSLFENGARSLIGFQWSLLRSDWP